MILLSYTAEINSSLPTEKNALVSFYKGVKSIVIFVGKKSWKASFILKCQSVKNKNH